MSRNRSQRYNEKGYSDLTAFGAVTNVVKEEKDIEVRMAKTVGIIKLIADVLGFKIDNRIVLIDKKTGKRFE